MQEPSMHVQRPTIPAVHLGRARARGAPALCVVWFVGLCSCNAALGGLEQDLLQPVREDDGRKVRQNGVGACLSKDRKP